MVARGLFASEAQYQSFPSLSVDLHCHCILSGAYLLYVVLFTTILVKNIELILHRIIANPHVGQNARRSPWHAFALLHKLFQLL